MQKKRPKVGCPLDIAKTKMKSYGNGKLNRDKLLLYVNVYYK